MILSNIIYPSETRTDNMEVDYVIKRDGSKEEMQFDKILKRVKLLSDKLKINPSRVTQKVCSMIYPNINTSELDELAGQVASSLATEHPDYGTLASRIIISNHHKNTSPSFSESISILHDEGMIDNELKAMVEAHSTKLNDVIDYNRDFYIDYFGFKTLERSYLMRVKKKIIERPQHLFMRVALAINMGDLRAAIDTYELCSNKYYTHATPTLFNAGTKRPQLSSCFLLSMKDDSIEGIFSTLKDCAMISKWAGGIGLHIHNIRSKNSHIKGTNGISNGIIPMLRVFNNTARYVDQGGGKRNGSIAIYIEPWHRDIMDFLILRKNHGNEEERARDLFYAIWMPDLFMERVEVDGEWSLFCPNECPGLSDLVGDKFNAKYLEYEAGEFGKKVKARDIWYAILESQIETGTPYICYKDASNLKSNQQNLGTIKSSNLCTEIVEYSSKEESAVCNLASIGLSKYVEKDSSGQMFFNYDKLHEVTQVITKNLDNVIDINFYPIPETERSNKRHRPIGIGVQGLADVFAMLKLPFASDESAIVNERIFETIYHAALTQSMTLARMRTKGLTKLKELETMLNNNVLVFDTNKRLSLESEINALRRTLTPLDIELDRNDYLGTYSSFIGSPLQQGKFQFDLWDGTHADNYDWEGLRVEIKTHGVRNSLLVAPMPTASTSQILGNNECIEPFTSNIYLRRTLAGEFIVVNKYLMNDLLDLGLWNEDIKNDIIKHNGSIQHIQEIPEELREIYKTVWEIGNKPLIDMAATRGKYICQSQSLNLFMDKPTFQKLSSMHFYSWQKGLKTGIYYLRTKPVAQAQQFTIEPEKRAGVGGGVDDSNTTSKDTLLLACSRDNPDCEACGS
jgi:ribonucleoside-diphosphate reductase alpha chain